MLSIAAVTGHVSLGGWIVRNSDPRRIGKSSKNPLFIDLPFSPP